MTKVHYDHEIALLRLQLELGVEYCVAEQYTSLDIDNLWKDRTTTMLAITRHINQLKDKTKADYKLHNIENLNDNMTKVIINDDTNIAIQKAHNAAASANNLEALRLCVENFQECEVRTNMTKTVFSDGQSHAKIMLVGEAPGEQENIQGIPFCGRSGILLDKMLGTIGLSRQHNLYITNILFWRPPANRKPSSDEIAICQPFLHKHIALINPEIIIACGSTAVESLLDSAHTISKICGQSMSHYNPVLAKNICTIPLFHPSYLMRNPIAKKSTWFHLLQVAELIVVPSSSPSESPAT